MLQPGRNYILLIKDGSNNTIVGPVTVSWQGTNINTLAAFRDALSLRSNNIYYPYIKPSILTGIFRIEIDYKYFIDNSLGDPNTFTFVITDSISILTLQFQHGNYGYNPSNYPPGEVPCFTIGVQIPQPGIIPQQYVYYGSEDKQEFYVYYDSENHQPPTYVDF